MKFIQYNFRCQIVLSILILLSLGISSPSFSQNIRWLRVSELQSFINELGAEFEGEGTTGNQNFFSWPTQYSTDQTMTRGKGLWIGAKNFDDPVEGKLKSVKVIASGLRPTDERPNMIFEKDLKLVGKFYHPSVVVDDQNATVLHTYDLLDSLDENMPWDREVLVKFNTSMGISVTRRVMCFTDPNNNNYFINEYVFENTGIYNSNGDVKEQTLEDVWFYFISRYALAGVSSDGWGSTWGAFSSVWGASTIYNEFGKDINSPEFSDPVSALYQMRGFYAYYGPNADRTAVSYDEDWGCPDEADEGVLGSAKYVGCVTLHADTSPTNTTDDKRQPRTTWFINSDFDIMQATESQYDEVFMQRRYDFMSEGHPDKSHEEYVGDDYPTNYTDPDRQGGGGPSQGQGFGPYTMEPGDVIRIVYAEGASGLSWEKGREVGANWLKYYNSSGTPTLTLPNGSTTSNHNQYKKDWVFTGRDSIVQTYRNAMDNFASDYTIPQPPPPPSEFVVTSGGDKINLKWTDNATSHQNFDGYVIYRSEGNVMDYKTKYVKLFECGASNTVHVYDDTSAARGFDYYYYIQSKDDGSTNTVEPGKPLYSSLFYTLTSIPATLQRPAGNFLSEIRVVPNPYDIRARSFQFGDQSQYDRLAFYGLPPYCRLKIYTERGDLIWEKEHTKGTGDELWDSKTTYGQIVASGIYILYVEVIEDTYANEDKYARQDILDDDLKVMVNAGELMYSQGDLIYKKGESKIRKFVIIR